MDHPFRRCISNPTRSLEPDLTNQGPAPLVALNHASFCVAGIAGLAGCRRALACVNRCVHNA